MTIRTTTVFTRITLVLPCRYCGKRRDDEGFCGCDG